MMEKTPRVPRIIQLERAVVMFAAPLPAQKLQPKMFIFGPKEQSELNRIRAVSNDYLECFDGSFDSSRTVQTLMRTQKRKEVERNPPESRVQKKEFSMI